MDLAGVFVKDLPKLNSLSLFNSNGRRREFDDNEIKSLFVFCPTITSLSLHSAPISDKSLVMLLPKLGQLSTLKILEAPSITNSLFFIINENLPFIRVLEIGGKKSEYNFGISKEGIEVLCMANISIERLAFFFCARIGDDSVEIICKKFSKTLTSFHLERNCIEKCAAITDNCFKSISRCSKINELSIIYTRKLKTFAHLHIAALGNLRTLNLRNCPIQEDLAILTDCCPSLYEINLSGDSWVKSTTLIGLSKHRFLRILHIGHFEHAENTCEKKLKEYSPKGLFLEALFSRPDSFVALRTLYLEQECTLSYWLDVRIKRARPEMGIRFTEPDNLYKIL